jgi:ClpP class serine protease
MGWLLKDDTYQAMAHAHAGGFVVTAAQAQEHGAKFEPTAEGLPRNMRIAGDVAEIRIEGALTKKPDFFAWLFGGGNTTYTQIQQGLQIALADAAIKRVHLYVDSPGGHVDGLFDTLAMLDAFPKPVSVTASQACSAAYAIAAVAGKITATNEGAEFGSIGVAARFVVLDEIVDITSTNAPDKRPDVRTEEGKETVRKQLDAIHDLFVDAIAAGRSTTSDKVNETFGRGAVVLAGEAKRRRMVDKIAVKAIRPGDNEPTDPGDDEVAQTIGAEPQKDITMNLEQLKAQHPELYKQCVAEGHAAGLAAGQTAERKRVTAHLKLAKTMNAHDVAFKAIESGASVMDEDVHADYLSAGMNRRDQQAIQGDAAVAAAAIANPPTAHGVAAPTVPTLPAAAPAPGTVPGATAAAEPDLGDQVVAVLKAQKSKKVA